ncbi:MAG: hypothetical protein WC473_03120 [Patescibacteria group bacterium]
MFNKNSNGCTPLLHHLASTLDIKIQYVDKLSYLTGEDCEFKLDVLLVHPNLSPIMWAALRECVQKNPHIKFVILLDSESVSCFNASGLSGTANIETIHWTNEREFQKIIQLMENARHSAD